MFFAEEFRRFVERVRAPMLSAAERLAKRPDFPRLARRILLNQWHVIVASEHLLTQAAKNSSGELREYFCRKIADEAGHAAMLFQDLTAIRLDLTPPTDPNLIAMVGSQYFHINQGETAAFLGYIGLLEMSAPPVSALEQFEAAADIPPRALKCARMHAGADVEHLKDLGAALDVLPEHLQSGVLANAAHSALFQTMALETLLNLPEPETRAAQ